MADKNYQTANFEKEQGVNLSSVLGDKNYGYNLTPTDGNQSNKMKFSSNDGRYTLTIENNGDITLPFTTNAGLSDASANLASLKTILDQVNRWQ